MPTRIGPPRARLLAGAATVVVLVGAAAGTATSGLGDSAGESSAGRPALTASPGRSAQGPDRFAVDSAAVSVPPARSGHRPAPQWHPFAPTRLQLLPDESGPGAPVDRVSVRGDGSLELPADPNRVGWWAQGARAGSPVGTVLIAGHVDAEGYGLGFFAALAGLREGQIVRLAAGTHEQRYRIDTITTQDSEELARTGDRLLDRSGPARLVLITCGGPFDRATGRYTRNVVVEAAPLP